MTKDQLAQYRQGYRAYNANREIEKQREAESYSKAYQEQNTPQPEQTEQRKPVFIPTISPNFQEGGVIRNETFGDKALSVISKVNDTISTPIDTVTNSYYAGVPDLIRSKVFPEQQKALEERQAKTPILTGALKMAGSVAPAVAIEKAAVKALPSVFSGLGKYTDLAARGIVGGAGVGAVEGLTEGIKNNKGLSGTLQNIGDKAYDYALGGAALAPAFGKVGSVIGDIKTNRALSNIDNSYNTLRNEGIFGAKTSASPTYSNTLQINKLLNDLNVGTRLRNVGNKPMPLALKPARVPDSEVIFAGDGTIPPRPRTELLQLPSGQKPLMLKEGTFLQPPVKPVGLGKSPQGVFTIKPETKIVATKFGKGKNLLNSTSTAEFPRSIEDFKPQNKTVEPIKKYAEQMEQYKNPFPKQENNFKIEKPFQAFPAEVKNINVPPKVPSQFSKEIFPKLPNMKNVGTKTKTLPVESNLKPLKSQGDIIQPSTKLNAPEATTTQNNIKLVEKPQFFRGNENIPQKTSKYTDDIQNKLNNLDKQYQKDFGDKKGWPRSISEKHSFERRKIIQGDSLIPVEGGLATGELRNKLKTLKTNYKGKEVITPDGEGIITGKKNWVGMEVEFADGTKRYFPSKDIAGKLDVDSEIKLQNDARIEQRYKESQTSKQSNKVTKQEPIKQETPQKTITQEQKPIQEIKPTSEPLPNKTESIYKNKEVNTPDGKGYSLGETSTGDVIVNINGKVKTYKSEQVQIKPSINNTAIKQGKTGASATNTVETSANPQRNTNNSSTATMTRESQVKTNTMVNKIPELQTPEGQKFAKDFEATVNVKPDDISIDRANEMLSNDYEGTFNKILNGELKTKEDNLAAWQIARDLFAAKDYNTANKLIQKIRPIITDSAQIIQSMSTVPKDSLEGIAYNARKIIDSVTEKAFKDSPELLSQINKETGIIKDVLKSNFKLLNINLQLFAETVNKDLKKALGSLYNKDYIKSITKLLEEGIYSDPKIAKAIKNGYAKPEMLSDKVMETIEKAIKQKYKIPSFDGDDLKKISEMWEKAKDLPKNEYAYREAMDNIDKIIREKLPKTLADKAATYQFINLYGNSITPLKIGGGNITSLGQDYLKNVLRHVIDKIIPGKTVTAMPSLKTQFKGLIKRTKEVYKDYKGEVDTDPFTMSYDFDMKRGLTFTNKFMREAEKIVKLAMSVMESPYKQAVYDDFLKMKMKVANVAEPTPEMINSAVEEAQKLMFANRSKASNAVEGLRKGINDATNTGINKLLPQKYQISDTGRFGLGNLVQPVIKTPINMVGKAIEYSPLNLLTIRNREQFVDKTAKAIIGSAIAGLVGYKGKKTGYITGGVPKDADARDYAEDSGRQPYALKLGNKTYDINYIQPFGMLVSFGAELASDRKEKEWYSPMVAAMDSLINQGMMTGFAKLLGQTATKAGSLSENILDAVTGGANTMVPFSSAQNQVSKLIDTNKRETRDDSILKRNLINKTIARTPFRKFLPEKINNQGEKVREDSWYNTLFTPGKVKDLKDDAVTNELMRLYDKSLQTKQFPLKASDKITYKTTQKGKPQIKTLPPKKIEEFKVQLGKTNVEAVKKTIKTPEYRKADDEEKAKLISDAMSKNKQEVETKILKSLGIKEYKPNK